MHSRAAGTVHAPRLRSVFVYLVGEDDIKPCVFESNIKASGAGEQRDSISCSQLFDIIGNLPLGIHTEHFILS